MFAATDCYSKPFVQVKNEQFYVGDSRWFPFGVMYRPLYAQPGVGQEPKDWIEYYDPKAIDEDLDLMQSLGLNAVRLMDDESFNNNHRDKNWATFPTANDSYKTRFGDFLDRLGKRGMKAQLFMHYTPEGSRYIPGVFDLVGNRKTREQSMALIQKIISELGLAHRPEIWSYEIDWEPHVASENTRNSKRALEMWNRWIIDQYGSARNATKSWGYLGKTVTIDDINYISAPSNDEVVNDGQWTKKSVAYRRFLTELINKKYAYLRRAIKEVDTNHLINAQRCAFLGRIPDHDSTILYPIRHTYAYLDYFGYTFSPYDTWGLFDENEYHNNDDKFRKQGFAVRYSKYGVPVIFTEYGASTWYKDFPEQTEEHLELIQRLHYQRMLEIGREFGIDGTLAWWWVGKRPMSKGDGEWSDWGIRRMDGTLKPCSETIKEQGKLISNSSEYKSDSTIIVDEFAHANESDTYIEGKDAFLKALQEGKAPDVCSQYEGTDSGTCPLTRLDGSEDGFGPVRALDSSLGVVEVLDASGKWVDVQYGDRIAVGSGVAKLRMEAANTGDAQWLAGSVALVVKTDSTERIIPITRAVNANRRIVIEAQLPPGSVSLRMRAISRCDFGEVLRFTVDQQ